MNHPHEVEKNKCEDWFPKHDWSKWELVSKDRIYNFGSITTDKVYTGWAIVQKRTCKNCGLYQEKLEKISI